MDLWQDTTICWYFNECGVTCATPWSSMHVSQVHVRDGLKSKPDGTLLTNQNVTLARTWGNLSGEPWTTKALVQKTTYPAAYFVRFPRSSKSLYMASYNFFRLLCKTRLWIQTSRSKAATFLQNPRPLFSRDAQLPSKIVAQLSISSPLQIFCNRFCFPGMNKIA